MGNDGPNGVSNQQPLFGEGVFDRTGYERIKGYSWQGIILRENKTNPSNLAEIRPLIINGTPIPTTTQVMQQFVDLVDSGQISRYSCEQVVKKLQVNKVKQGDIEHIIALALERRWKDIDEAFMKGGIAQVRMLPLNVRVA